MKKIFIFGFLAFLGFAPHVFAQSFTALAPIPGLTDTSATSVIQSTGLASFFNNLYKYLIGLAATLAIIEIIWAGLDISFFHKDAVGAIVEDKGRIYNAIFGLILVLSPVLVFSIINPSILNLSLNLPPINLTTTPVTSGGGSGTSLPTAPAAGCTTANNSGSYFETAVCANRSDAQSYVCKNGLTLQVPDCKVPDAASGKCLDTSATAYCAGNTTTLTVYRYYQSYSGILIGDSTWVPSDAAAATTFTNGCVGNGGVVETTLTTAAKLFLATGVGVHIYQTTATNGCSSDYGTIPFDSSKGGGIVCYGNILSCNPPK